MVFSESERESLLDQLVDKKGMPLLGWRAQATHTRNMGMRIGKTDENGEFLLEGLAAGSHKVDCLPGDYMSRLRPVGGDMREGLKGLNLTKLVTTAMKFTVTDKVMIKNGEQSKLDLVFKYSEEDAAESEGLVKVEGSVRVGGQDLMEGMVFFQAAGSTAQGPIAPIQKGRFTLAGIQPGAWRWRVQAGFMAARVGGSSIVQIPAQASYELGLELSGGSLSGQVLHKEDGRPAAGVVLALASSSTTESATDKMDFGEGSLMTDEKGQFQFRGLPAGKYSIHAKEFAIRGGQRQRGQLANLDLGPDEERGNLILYLSRGASLEIQVKDDLGPRGNALVTLLTASGHRIQLYHRSLTDRQGVVTFPEVPAGEYRVVVDAPKAAPQVSDPIQISGTAAQMLEVTLERGVPAVAEVSGKWPEAGVGERILCSVFREDGILIKSESFVLAGTEKAPRTFDVGSYSPGRYLVRVESARFGVLETKQTVPAKGKAVWKIRLP